MSVFNDRVSLQSTKKGLSFNVSSCILIKVLGGILDIC